MHTITSDLIVLWVAAIVFIFAFMFFGATSLKDKENNIMTFGSIGIVLIGAIVVTVGQLVGWIGVW